MKIDEGEKKREVKQEIDIPFKFNRLLSTCDIYCSQIA